MDKKAKRTITLEHIEDRLKNESNTGVVMLMTLWLEQYIDGVLEALFVETGRNAMLKRLGGKLELKVALLRSLGLLAERVFQDLTNLVEMRNRFAHKPLDGTFSDPDIVPLLRNFSRQAKDGDDFYTFTMTLSEAVFFLNRARHFVTFAVEGKLPLSSLRLAADAGFPVPESEEEDGQ